MKSIILTIALLAYASIGFAQSNPIDFEPAGHGADWTWNVFENDTNPPLEIVDNPDQSGINTSAKVAKFTALSTGQAYAGVESAHGGMNLGKFVLDKSNSVIKIMVWKSVISDVGIKLVSDSSWSQGEIKVANTKVNQWEELTFDFSDYVNPPDGDGQLDQIVIFPDFKDRSEDHVIYFDNITFSASSSSTSDMPATAAPTPTQDPDSVISMFSSAYTNVPVDTWAASWSAATFTDSVKVGDSYVKKYSALDYAGIETIQNEIDASNMDYLHMDVWSPNITQFGIKLVDFGADGAYQGGDDSEYQVDFPNPEQGKWVSYDIPLSDFVGLTARKHLAQFVLVGQPTGGATIYVDNMYFYSQKGGQTSSYCGKVVTHLMNPAETASAIKLTITNVDAQSMKVVIQSTNDDTVDALIVNNVSGPITGSPAVSPVDTIGDKLSQTLTWTGTPPENVDLDVLWSKQSFAGNWQLSSDNITVPFAAGCGTNGGTSDIPTTPAPTPTQNQANVISMFSSAYNDVPVDTWRTDWSSATFEDSVMVGGTPVKKYSNLDFVGIETDSPHQIDASEMTNFHIDVWSADYTKFSVKLVDFGADGAYQGGDDSEYQVDFDMPEKGKWVSFDIPLSDFTGLTARKHLTQYILVGQPTGANTIYVDNMYFYKDTGTPVEKTKELPNSYSLNQNYPNPFNPTTNISYVLPKGGKVKIDVFNIKGQKVATLVNGYKSAGSHLITFNASHLASGIYTYRLVSGNFVQVKKMVLIK